MKKLIKALTKYEKILGVVLIAVAMTVGVHGLFSVLKSDETPVPDEGGRYTEGLVGEIIALNPLFGDFNAVDRDIAGLIFSGLTKYNPGTRNFVPDLATYELSEDKKTYTFTLKDNLTWHDGKPLTADDVYFTYHDIIQNPLFRNPILRAPFQGVEIKKTDKQKISFTLTHPNSFFISNTITGIVPKHILKDVPTEALDQAPFSLNPIGSGPYKVSGPPRIGKDNRMQIDLNVYKNYYGEKPRIREIRLFAFPDEEMLIKEQNALNGIPQVKSSLYEKLEETGRFQLVPYKLPQYEVIIINTDSTFGAQKAVRAALAKAINKKELATLLQHKAVVDTPFLELNQSSWIYQTNLEEANRILQENGWNKPEDSTFRQKGDTLLEMTLLAAAAPADTDRERELRKITNYLLSQWAKIGIKVKLDLSDEANFGDKMQNREYDLMLTGHNLGYNLDTYSFWHSSQANKNGLNLANYRSFQADTLLEGIRNTFFSKEKQEQLQNLEKVIANDIPAIFLYTPIYYYATDGKVKNLQINNFAFRQDRFANVARWYIKEK